MDDPGRAFQPGQSSILVDTLVWSSSFGVLTQAGLLSQQPECQLLRPGCAAPAGHELLAERGIGAFPLPKGLLEAFRVYHCQQQESGCARNGQFRALYAIAS